jgi:uncharacterized cofD-like protein
VFPATTEAVTLRAQVGSAFVEGQVAIQRAARSQPIERVSVVPHDAPASPGALGAIMEADQIVIGPGSLFTSLLAALAVPELRTAVALAAARVVQVANLATEAPETAGLDGTDHLLNLLAHQVRIDTFLYDRQCSLGVNEALVYEHGVMPVGADLGGNDVHDPEALAKCLADLL